MAEETDSYSHVSVLFSSRSQNSLPSQVFSYFVVLQRKILGFELDSVCTNGQAGKQTIHNAAETRPNPDIAV